MAHFKQSDIQFSYSLLLKCNYGYKSIKCNYLYYISSTYTVLANSTMAQGIVIDVYKHLELLFFFFNMTNTQSEKNKTHLKCNKESQMAGHQSFFL